MVSLFGGFTQRKLRAVILSLKPLEATIEQAKGITLAFCEHAVLLEAWSKAANSRSYWDLVPHGHTTLSLRKLIWNEVDSVALPDDSSSLDTKPPSSLSSPFCGHRIWCR